MPGELGPRRKSVIATILGATLLLGASPDSAFFNIPAGTRLRFHLVAPVSSDRSATGQTFSFVLLDPVTVDGHAALAAGAVGEGTIFLAGHAGSAGHEGDLTLRLDSIRTVDERHALFEDQRFTVNGHNRKVQSAVLGFVPFVGLGAHFIRGSEIAIEPQTPLETVLDRPARIMDVLMDLPSPLASPAAGPPAMLPSATPS